MKKYLIYIVLISISFVYGKALSGQKVSLITVMTLNVRYDNPDDGINRWANRKQLVSSAIADQDIDIAGMQEVLNSQMADLDDLLPGYDYVGVGREDGRMKGEAVPIFFKLYRFSLIDHGTFWLSENPRDTGSVGWNAALTRICTWGKFLDKSTGLEFYFLNTHFDHLGDTARVESAGVILDFISRQTGNLPLILTGDFNSSSTDEPYSVLTNPEDSLKDVCRSGNFFQACNEGTFNGFGTQKDPERIDMVFFKGGWEVDGYKVLKIKQGDVFISDHWPVVAELKFEN